MVHVSLVNHCNVKDLGDLPNRDGLQVPSGMVTAAALHKQYEIAQKYKIGTFILCTTILLPVLAWPGLEPF